MQNSIEGDQQWIRQIGSVENDAVFAVAGDATGNVYATGYTDGALEGQNLGRSDAFVAKFDSMGSLLWTRQLGSSSYDYGRGIACDKFGNVYVTGRTEGALDGTNYYDGIDLFIAKYDSTGTLEWSRQLTDGQLDYGNAVLTDGLGGVYIAGVAFEGHGPNTNALLAKFDTNGNHIWSRQVGSSARDVANGLAIDDLANIYIAGGTTGSLAGPIAGDSDAFIAKYDLSGTQLWTRQFGTDGFDSASDLSTDENGNVWITGLTNGDAFLKKFNSTAENLWSQTFGTTQSTESGRAVASDRNGGVYFSGATSGNLAGSNRGEVDAFIAKVRVIPEPTTLALVVPLLPLIIRHLHFPCDQL